MAKYEKKLTGNFTHLLDYLDRQILTRSSSASYEDGSDWFSGDVRCAVRVYERYSYTGSNRVSLSLTLMGRGNELFLSAIASGGSQAMFFKINTLGEKAFLETLIDSVTEYEREMRP